MPWKQSVKYLSVTIALRFRPTFRKLTSASVRVGLPAPKIRQGVSEPEDSRIHISYTETAAAIRGCDW